jgi:hypothetical protein
MLLKEVRGISSMLQLLCKSCLGASSVRIEIEGRREEEENGDLTYKN